jgi:hypothetical protein
LKHHTDATELEGSTLMTRHLPAVGFVQTCDDAQEPRLANSGGPEQRGDLTRDDVGPYAVFDLERDPFEHLILSEPLPNVSHGKQYLACSHQRLILS